MATCSVEKSSSYGDLSSPVWPYNQQGETVDHRACAAQAAGDHDALRMLTMAVGDDGGFDFQAGYQGRKKRSYDGGGSAEAAVEGSGNLRNMGGCGRHGGGGGVSSAVPSCPRDRLQRHRVQVAGKVRIPEAWEGEARLGEWVSSREVEEALQPAGLFSARAALIAARPSRISPPSSAGFTSPALVPASTPRKVTLRS